MNNATSRHTHTQPQPHKGEVCFHTTVGQLFEDSSDCTAHTAPSLARRWQANIRSDNYGLREDRET